MQQTRPNGVFNNEAMPAISHAEFKSQPLGNIGAETLKAFGRLGMVLLAAGTVAALAMAPRIMGGVFKQAGAEAVQPLPVCPSGKNEMTIQLGDGVPRTVTFAASSCRMALVQ